MADAVARYDLTVWVRVSGGMNVETTFGLRGVGDLFAQWRQRPLATRGEVYRTILRYHRPELLG